jgi:hypothetical protein
MCWQKVGTHAHRCGGFGGPPPRKCLNLDALKCDFRPILAVQFWRKMILSCYVRQWKFDRLLNYFEIGDSVHRIFRGNFFCYSSQVCSAQQGMLLLDPSVQSKIEICGVILLSYTCTLTYYDVYIFLAFLATQFTGDSSGSRWTTHFTTQD